MINIRNSIFETNSSSMHSLAILNDFNKKYKIFNRLYIALRTYDRNPQYILDTPSKKLSYLFSYYLSRWDDGFLHTTNNSNKFKFHNKKRYVTKIINKMLKNDHIASEYFGDKIQKKKFFDIYNKVKNILNTKLIFKVVDSTNNIWVTYDQSIISVIVNNKIDLKEFILNPNYVVFVDGDEYCKFNYYYKKYNLK